MGQGWFTSFSEANEMSSRAPHFLNCFLITDGQYSRIRVAWEADCVNMTLRSATYKLGDTEHVLTSLGRSLTCKIGLITAPTLLGRRVGESEIS